MDKIIYEVENKIEKLETYKRFLKCIEHPSKKNNILFFKSKNIGLLEKNFISFLRGWYKIERNRQSFNEKSSKTKSSCTTSLRGLYNIGTDRNVLHNLNPKKNGSYTTSLNYIDKNKYIRDLYYTLKLNVGGKKRKRQPYVPKPRKKRKVDIEFYNWIIDLLPSFILLKYNLIKPKKIKILSNLIKVGNYDIEEIMINVLFLGDYAIKFLKINGLKEFAKIASYLDVSIVAPIKNIKEEEDFHFFYYKELIISANINLLRTICPNYVDTRYMTKYYGKDRDISYVIIMEKLLTYENIKDFDIFKNFGTYRIIFLQLIYGLYCGDEWFNFRHNDLHIGNVGFVQIPKYIEKLIFIFDSENKYSFDVKRFPYFVKIFDFGVSELDPINKNENIIIEKTFDIFQREKGNKEDLTQINYDLNIKFPKKILYIEGFTEFKKNFNNTELQSSENYFTELIKLDFFEPLNLSDEDFNKIKNRKNVLIYEYKDMPKLELLPKNFYLWKDDEVKRKLFQGI